MREYRKRSSPSENTVQDWFYWPDTAWGSHDFDKTRFPDAKAMVDEVHALHGHVMISVWPKFYPTTDNAKALAAHGWLYQGNLKMGNKEDRKSVVSGKSVSVRVALGGSRIIKNKRSQ